MPRRLARLLAPLLWIIGAAVVMQPAARADGTLTVHIVNDGVDNLLVTLYDRNLRRHQTVLSGQPIYGNASVATSISADASGRGHVFWTATTMGRDMRQCGRQDRPNVNDGEAIHVHANGSCARRR